MYPYRFLILLFALCVAMTAQAQDRTCYDGVRQRGIKEYNAGNYERAIELWKVAKTCSYVPGNNDLDSWINKANDKLTAPPPPTRQPYEPEMVLVPGGSFQMGSNDGDDDEKPVHRVSVQDFYIGKYEVTVGQYLFFVNATNSHHPEWMEKGNKYNIQTGTEDHYKKIGNALTNENNPIVGISWNDAVAYAKWLSEKTGKRYRLPTEAEWEYAARGGKKTNGYTYAGSNTIDEVAWYTSNSGNKTHPVGQKQANELDIHDMSGNVWEWVQDCWHDSYAGAPTNGSAWTSGECDRRVLRGGSWYNNDYYCRVANRSGNDPNGRDFNDGFRLAQDR